MRREASPPRPDLAARAKALGFAYAFPGGQTYWDESARYVFSLREIEADLETATAELHKLALALVERVVADKRLYARLRLPAHARELIADSWRRRDPSLYGRFDFAYDGSGPPKLLEYNADTPTSLYESAVFQWLWLEEAIDCGVLPSGADQFNSLHDKLIARWGDIARGPVHCACCSDSVEDLGTTAYLADCAIQAGLKAAVIDLADIGSNGDMFVDRTGRTIETLFKLHPWEWMLAEPFGRHKAMRRVNFVEPAWKAILSNKGALALLWEMAPGHPNLLPCFFDDDPAAQTLGASYARKPLFSREGANVTLMRDGRVLAQTRGGYGAEGHVRQALAPLGDFAGARPVLGCWLVGDAPAGLGVREDSGPITTDRSRFVPHVILD